MNAPASNVSASLACIASRSGASGVRRSKSGIDMKLARHRRRPDDACYPPSMYTPRSLRPVAPPGGVAVREEWLDPQVLRLEVAGAVELATVGDLAARIAAGADAGARWVVLDLTRVA